MNTGVKRFNPKNENENSIKSDNYTRVKHIWTYTQKAINMAKSRFAKFFESIPKVSLNKISLVVPLVLSFYALYQTCQNLEITERSANESKRSADVAQEALALQQQQYKDFKENEELRRIEDSEKQRKDIELTEQQISALKTQANALNRGVRNTEISQSPYLGVSNLGFRVINLERPDSVVLGYSVKNDGVRHALLNKVTLMILDNNFKVAGIHPTYADNTIIPNGFDGFSQNVILTLDKKRCLVCNINDILKLGDVYFCLVYEYYDPFTSHTQLIKSRYFFYKWVKKDRSNLLFTGSKNVVLYSADLCTNKNEISKILEVARANKI